APDRRLGRRPGEAVRVGWGHAGSSDAARVRPARPARPKRGKADDAEDDPARGMGSRVSARVELPPRLRLTAAAKARSRRKWVALHRHRAWRRIPARRAGLRKS